MNNVNKLKPTGIFTNYIFKAIPLAFDESLSYYETLAGLLAYLKDTVIPTVNNNADVIIELENFVNDYFTNLDLQEEINNKLDQMVEDGTFERLFDDLYLNKNDFRTRLYFSKIGRLNITNYINNGYANMQAGVYIGNNKYVYPLIKNDNLGSVRLFKLDFNSGMILDYNDLTGIFHANGACLKDNHIFFTQTFDDTRTDKFGIVEVDPDTLEVVTIHNINFNDLNVNETILGIGYDNEEDKFYLIARNYFYVADTDFNVEKIVSMKFPLNKNLIRQGGTFYDKYLCIVVNNENAIICFDKDTGNVHHIIDIGEHQNNNFFGEIENVSVYNNELYINSNLIHHNASNLSLIQFFKANIDGGGLPQTIANNISFQNNVVLTCYVNKTRYNTLTDFDKFTCDGTGSKPFETLAEALCYIDNVYPYDIEIGDTNDYPESLAIYNQNLQIKGNHSTFGSLKVVSSKLSLSNFYIKHAEYRTPSFGTHPEYIIPLYITLNSEVSMTGDCGYDYTSCLADDMRYTCIVENSTFIDGSGDNTYNEVNYSKFLKDNNDISPLVIMSNICTSNSVNILNNVTHFTLVKDTTDTHTNSTLFSLAGLKPYTNSIRGLWLAVNISGLETEYQKFDANNLSRRIVIEDFDNNIKYGLKCSYSPNTSQFRVTPFKYNNSTNSWERDTTTTWYAFYMFEI